MTVKTILYILTTPISIWALDALNIEGKFKKNRYYQSRILYLMISLSLSYLTVNFFYDFFLKFNISYRVSGALSILLINVMLSSQYVRFYCIFFVSLLNSFPIKNS